MDTFNNNNQQPLQTQAASAKDSDPTTLAKGPALGATSNVELRPLRNAEADANGPGEHQNLRPQGAATGSDVEKASGTTGGKGPARNGNQNGRMRTAAFIVALFVCILSVLIFAFFIPCPVVVPPRSAWEVPLPAHAETATLAMLRINKDPIPDVVVLYRTLNDSSSATARCVKAGFAAGCTEVMALSGLDGARLWRRPLSGRPSNLRCDGKYGGFKAEQVRCLLSGEIGPLRCILANKGKDMWEAWLGAEDESPRVLTPPLEVGDLNGDTIPDLLFWVAPSVTSANGSFLFLSGSSGKRIGSAVSLDAIAPGEKSLPLRLLVTAHGAPFVLMASGAEVQALPLAQIYLRAVSTASHSAAPPTLQPHATAWANMANNLTGIVLVHRSSSGPIEAVVPIPVRAWHGHPALLVATAGNIRLFNASGLETLWEVSVSRLLSLPVYGFFNNDSIPDILVEHESGPGLKQVFVLDGLSGSVLWAAALGASGGRAAGPSAFSVVGGGRDVFTFWGSGAPGDAMNGSGPAVQRTIHQLYLLHGEHPHLLIPLANSSGPVEGHTAALWEKDKDIGYTFVATPGADGGNGIDGSDEDPPGALLRHFRFSDAFSTHTEPLPVPGMRAEPGAEAGEGLEWLIHLKFQAPRSEDVM